MLYGTWMVHERNDQISNSRIPRITGLGRDAQVCEAEGGCRYLPKIVFLNLPAGTYFGMQDKAGVQQDQTGQQYDQKIKRTPGCFRDFCVHFFPWRIFIPDRMDWTRLSVISLKTTILSPL